MSEQPLNSLERFRKRPGRLVLETHSHCEVPAGCGGVVLRWRDPRAALPLLVAAYSTSKWALFIDGAEVTRTGLDLAPGPHALALTLDEIDLTGGLFLLSLFHDPARGDKHTDSPFTDWAWQLVSAADGSWKATLAEPAEGWLTAAVAGLDWEALTRTVATPAVDWARPGAFQLHRCFEAGAAYLALPGGISGRGKVWVRTAFTVPMI
jgi:hypothetical protein